MMGEMIGLVGKKARIYFEDEGKVKPRIATIVSENAGFLMWENEFGVEAMPLHKIVRVVII